MNFPTGIRESLGLSVGGSKVGDEYTEYLAGKPLGLAGKLLGVCFHFSPLSGIH